MLTSGSLQREISPEFLVASEDVPSPRPWSRRGSVCPSAKPGTVAHRWHHGMPRDATGCYGMLRDATGTGRPGIFCFFLGFSAEFLGPWDSTCHDLPWSAMIYMTWGPKRFLMVSVWLLCHKISQVAIHILPVIWMVSAWKFHEAFWNKQMLSGSFLKAKCIDNMGWVITHCKFLCFLLLFGNVWHVHSWNMLKSAGWPGSFGKGSWALLQSGRTCGGNHQTWENTESFDA